MRTESRIGLVTALAFWGCGGAEPAATAPAPEAVRPAAEAEAWHARAVSLSLDGRLVQAIGAFERAVAMRPREAAWRFELGSAYWRAYAGKVVGDRGGFLRRAEEEAGRAIERDRTESEYHLLRARCRRERFRLRGAASDYHRAIALDPYRSSTYLELGRLYAWASRRLSRSGLLELSERVLLAGTRLAGRPELSPRDRAVLPDVDYELGRLYRWRSMTEPDPSVERDLRGLAIERFARIRRTHHDRGLVNSELAELYWADLDMRAACFSARAALREIDAGDPERAGLRAFMAGIARGGCAGSYDAAPLDDPDPPARTAPGEGSPDPGAAAPVATGRFDPDLPPVPADLPDEPPPSGLGETYALATF